MNIRERIKKLEEYQKMLYIVDMLDGFVNQGKLHDKYLRRIIPEQIRLIEKFAQEQQGISVIGDCHTEDSVELKYYDPHCLEGTDEARLVPELQPYTKNAWIYKKNSTCAMFAPHMLSDLKAMKNLKEVVAAGCEADLCVPHFLIPLKCYFNEINRDVAVFAVKKGIDTFHIEGVHDRTKYREFGYAMMEQAGIILVEDINELEKREREMGLVLRKDRR